MVKSQTPGEYAVPESLEPHFDELLPKLDVETLRYLDEAGWYRVGLMVAITGPSGNIMLLRHNQRPKNNADTWGPLGETTKGNGPVIEQPLQTLYRGIKEEMGIDDPQSLGLEMQGSMGWVINQWPYGNNAVGRFACAISFPVYVSSKVEDYLRMLEHSDQEVSGSRFYTPETIMNLEERNLRMGVKGWLKQLSIAGLTGPPDQEKLVGVDFSQIFESTMHDIELS